MHAPNPKAIQCCTFEYALLVNTCSAKSAVVRTQNESQLFFSEIFSKLVAARALVQFHYIFGVFPFFRWVGNFLFAVWAFDHLRSLSDVYGLTIYYFLIMLIYPSY